MGLKEIVKTAFDGLPHSAKYLLAMSGGVDSTVLFHLMVELDLNFEVAHANFGLREEQSSQDAIFVEQLCRRNQIQFHVKEFDTQAYVEQNNESIQSAARKLRYNWFDRLLSDNNLDRIVTAHTSNDSLETFIINLMRGTGLNGLLGIQNTNERFRPLLGISKNEVIEYAQKNKIEWREDISNAKDDYLRNKIRHHIIPKFEEIDTQFLTQFKQTTHYLKNDVKIINDYIDGLRFRIFTEKSHYIKISISDLKDITNPNILHYLFKPYGFTHPQEIVKLIHGNESSEIQSNNYRLIKNRSHLHLTKKLLDNRVEYLIYEAGRIESPIKLQLTRLESPPANGKGLLDFEKVKFPLSLRIRKNGDIFYPKGMGGQSKKLSKFYKDEKFSKLEKESTWLLCDADDNIIWVVGHRYDERFIATNKTKKWLHIESLD